MSKLHRGDSATDELVRSVVIAPLEGMESSPPHAVTAAVTTGGALRIALWRVARDGSTITRERSHVEGEASEVALTTAHGHVITAVIGQGDRLQVSSWGTDFTPRGSAPGVSGSRVSIVEARALLQNRFVTAMRDSDGHLRLDAWLIPFDGTVSHITQGRGGKIEEVKVVDMGSSGPEVGPGQLLNVVVRRPDDHLEPVHDLGVASVASDFRPGEKNVIVTAARTANDQLKVTAWRVDPPPNENFEVAFVELRCLETTDDRDGPDEPYAVFITVDLSNPSRFAVRRTRVFQNVDEDAPHNTRLQLVDIPSEGSKNTVFQRIQDPDRLVILVGLMESDDSKADKVMNEAAARVRTLSSQLSINSRRADVVPQLLKAFGDGLRAGAHVPGDFDSDDDLIAPVQVLPILRADLDKANTTLKKVTKTLSFVGIGEDGKYKLTFEIVALTAT